MDSRKQIQNALNDLYVSIDEIKEAIEEKEEQCRVLREGIVGAQGKIAAYRHTLELLPKVRPKGKRGTDA